MRSTRRRFRDGDDVRSGVFYFFNDRLAQVATGLRFDSFKRRRSVTLYRNDTHSCVLGIFRHLYYYVIVAWPVRNERKRFIFSAIKNGMKYSGTVRLLYRRVTDFRRTAYSSV